MELTKIEKRIIDTIRTLAMDAVQKAGSGHPGTAMALAPAAFILWDRIMKYNPSNPEWFNRDRFILSNGHASILQYTMLHLTGYDLDPEELKHFRKWGSRTPGHPEYGLTPGIETTTGPLGQGFMNAVGIAMAEAHLAAKYNKKDLDIIDHYTFGFCSDGDLMEGASHEGASLAGHFGLGKLIFLYDDNHISIDGNTEITYDDDVKQRFQGYNWHVQDLGESANDLEKIHEAYRRAIDEKDKPSLIILRTHIAYGSPGKQDTAAAHGSPLGDEEVKKTKEIYGWPPEKTFYIPEGVKEYMRKAIARGVKKEKEWRKVFERWKCEYPGLHSELRKGMQLALPDGWDGEIPRFSAEDGPVATRKASSEIMNSFTGKLPYLLGGSADLASSTKTLIKDSGYIEKGKFMNRNIPWGVREHAMCAASSGMILHGGLRTFAATFFIFTDYARPAIRLAALMKLPAIYILTHDSIGLGGDGPTHQPVAHLASFRALPNMYVFRPADANEVAFTWKAVLRRKEGPSMMILTRQKVPVTDRSVYEKAEGVLRGAYVLSREQGENPDTLLLATGSEVAVALEAQKKLEEEGIDARVVSMPCWELFRGQPREYRNEVLPDHISSRIAIEAGASFGWNEWIGDEGEIVAVDQYGASADYEDNFQHYGITVKNLVSKVNKQPDLSI